MRVETTTASRASRLELTPTLVRRLAYASLASIYVVITTGAVVRLTASGLGCENWPKCGDTPFPAKEGHALIEFGNRLIGLGTITMTFVAWLAVRRAKELPSWARNLALAVFLGTLAQVPLGGLTVIFELHPLLVMAHFLLALVVLGLATVVALESRGAEAGRTAPLVPRELARLGVVLAAACLGLIVSGAFVTAAGPHSGGSDIERLGNPTVALVAHAASTAVFGAALMLVVGYLAARRGHAPRLFRASLGVVGLVLVQMALGELQFRLDLPWLLVLVHVATAAAVWVATVALVTMFWRPLRGLAPDRTPAET